MSYLDECQGASMNAPKKVIQAQLLLLREESHRKLFIRIITNPDTICTTENAILIYSVFESFEDNAA